MGAHREQQCGGHVGHAPRQHGRVVEVLPLELVAHLVRVRVRVRVLPRELAAHQVALDLVAEWRQRQRGLEQRRLQLALLPSVSE